VIVTYDVSREPQHMGVMDVEWSTTPLFGGPFTLGIYFGYGRLATQAKMLAAKQRHEDPPSKTGTPFPIMVAKGVRKSFLSASLMLQLNFLL
jgi:hypothetical protein